MSETIDLDTPAPPGGQVVKLGGEAYPVRDVLDIPMEEIDEMDTLQAEMRGKPWREQLAMSRRQVQILIPTMPEAVLMKMTGRQIVEIMVTIMGVVPIQAGAVPADQAPPQET